MPWNPRVGRDTRAGLTTLVVAALLLSGLPLAAAATGLVQGRSSGSTGAGSRTESLEHDLADARRLSGPEGMVRGDNHGATVDADEPDQADAAAASWYSWTAPDDGTAYFLTHFTGLDTTLEVYVGDHMGGLTKVTSNDDIGPKDGRSLQSFVQFPVTEGTVYHVAVDGYIHPDGTRETGEWKLAWGLRPGNDQFADAKELSGDFGSVSGRTSGAGSQGSELDHAGVGPEASVWYRWTAPTSGPAVMSTEGSGLDTILAVYAGEGMGGLTEVVSNDDVVPEPADDRRVPQSRVAFEAAAGTTYHVAVGGSHERGDFVLSYELGLPALRIGDVKVTEGDRGFRRARLPVSLSRPSLRPVSVSYATADRAAAAPRDYRRHSGSLTFPAGTTAGTIVVPVLGDRLDERAESLVVNLSSPVNGDFADRRGRVTIVDDDPPRRARIGNARVRERDSGTRVMRFKVRLGAPSGKVVQMRYATRNGRARAWRDYIPTTGWLTFEPGQTAKTIRVRVKGDRLRERNETLQVNLSRPRNVDFIDRRGVGVIIDDDR